MRFAAGKNAPGCNLDVQGSSEDSSCNTNHFDAVEFDAVGPVSYRAPDYEYGVKACRKADCGIKEAGVYLGRTLPSLLDEGCDIQARAHREATLNQYKRRATPTGDWQSYTLGDIRQAADEIALALKRYKAGGTGTPLKNDNKRIVASAGEPVCAALLMNSDVFFVMADIGCLLAQLVTVPMLPEQPVDATELMLKETEAAVLFVSSLNQVKALRPIFPHLTALRLIVVASSISQEQQDRSTTLQWAIPSTIELISLDTLRQQAQWSSTKAKALRDAISPQDLATIVYTQRANGRPLGAMLTHENLSGSVLAAFSTLPCLRKGANEVALSFLPLHHIFARGFIYGSLSYGQNLYFSNPRLVMKHLCELRPTVFFTVPRLLEKVYEGWQATPQQLCGPMAKPKKMAIAWANQLAQRYRLDQHLTSESAYKRLSWQLPLRALSALSYKAQLWLARQTVFRPLRNLFGGRLNCFISGGAALPPEVMTLLSAAGLVICQGYGLTEASSTLCFTRRQWSRAGTVGVPMPGVTIALAPDGEVMVNAPYVMQGYYKAPEATQAVLENGWLHTGDRGQFSDDGLLTLTGCKKQLFKLSIGEYIAPSPIEAALRQSPLVHQSLVVGPGRKFCGILIFPNMPALTAHAQQLGLSTPTELLCHHPQILNIYQSLVDQTNESLPSWSRVKRFALINAELTQENGRLLAPERPNRELLYRTLVEEIDKLYQTPTKQSVTTSLNNPIAGQILPEAPA